MEKEEIRLILERQKLFFSSGKTLPVDYRLEVLKKLRSLILDHEKDLLDALWADFRKPGFEVLATESRFVLSEMNLIIRKLRKWSAKKRVRTPLVNFIATSYTVPQPFGQVLIMSPWNFPFQLTLVPALGALAAGNCVVLKASQKVPETARVIKNIFDHFPKELILVAEGDHSVSNFLMDYKFDYIFFTGSQKRGKILMAKAAENLIPITLELGGKTPCVVAADARLDFAARRIAWGKFINGGQTCIAPDYLLVDSEVKEQLLEMIKREITVFYGKDPSASNDLCRMVSPDRTEKMVSFMKHGKIIAGGITSMADNYVSPTIIDGVTPDDPVMQEEIFGPVLPVITFRHFDEVYSVINRHPKSLAAYIFTRNNKQAEEFLSKTQSGSAAINDTIMQVSVPELPFGGIGPSGIGRYHGRKSFETFSNIRSVMKKSNLVDIFVRYPPYTALKTKMLKMLLK